MLEDKSVVAIIQARMGSTRLPGKVLKEIRGEAILGWVVERTKRAGEVDAVVVATTTHNRDQAIAEYCQKHDYPVVRGSEFDVLDRFYQAARKFQADVVVRITADCPFIDPSVIDKTVRGLFKANPPADFAANRLPPPYSRTYPVGLDVEVVPFQILEEVWEKAGQPHHREHVMPYIYEHPEQFEIVLVDAEKDYGELRWTVDTWEDLKLVREVAKRFEGRNDFSWMEIVSLFMEAPELKDINARVRQKASDDVDQRSG